MFTVRQPHASVFPYLLELTKARPVMVEGGSPVKCESWHRPSVGQLKHNVDATFFGDVHVVNNTAVRCYVGF